MRYAAWVCCFCLAVVAGVWLTGAEPAGDGRQAQADLLFQQGNFKEALVEYRAMVTNPRTSPQAIKHALQRATNSLKRLGSEQELDILREEVARIHAARWEVLEAVALNYIQQSHQGYIVEGEFQRGNRRSSEGAQYADATQRDRVRALQLMLQAMPLAKTAEPKPQGEFYLNFARVVLFTRENPHVSWKLQALTALDQLPDYDQQAPYFFGRRGWGNTAPTRGAPVDAEGNPVFYGVPADWDAAASDGQRWRWLLEQARQADPALQNQVLMTWAGFLHQNFGVHTMREMIRPLLARAEQAEDGAELNEQTGPFALTTLRETETIAKLATGVKRFSLPDEFNFIRIYQQVLAEPATGHAEQAAGILAQIFENRQQYPRAAGYWRESLEKFKDDKQQTKAKRLSQIVDPWGTFESTTTQGAGRGAELSFRFRNGELLELEAFALNHQLLLADVKTFLKSNPQRWTGNEADIGNLGHRIVNQNQQKYLGERVAQWSLELKPRSNHFDRRIDITTPLAKAGAYLLIAKLKNGNTSRVIVWLDDTAIVKKQLDNRQWYYVADARTGEPVPGARLEFFGYTTERLDGRRMLTKVSEFVDQTNAEGQVTVGAQRQEQGYNWLISASTPEGRFAYLGFTGIWYQEHHWDRYEQNKVYVITDRPVYRPGQKVNFKVWVRRADYTQNEKDPFAGGKFKLEITDPRSEKLLEQEFTADDQGGFSGEIELPRDATLGVYSISLPWREDLNVGGGNAFRVEEYKKPEYEVTVDAPTEPVQLGDKISATIRARYYFGAPVVNATVKYKVERTTHSARWYPVEPWDWLYGNGYWWFGENYDWYPGFGRWGCLAPTPAWWGLSADPPELVLENEVKIGADGTVRVEIDTALAREIHGDQDHRYAITAEVVDESRRTIVGQGSVLVARDPFQVHVWLNRGYYRVGDVVTAKIKVQTLDHKPIAGDGELKLLAIKYDAEGTPTETEIEKWPLNTDATGSASQQFKAAEPGQYRLAYSVTDARGNTREGAFIFLVRGEESTLVDYRFNDLELIPDQKTYQPGETVRLLINTNRRDATVLLFVRPSNGVYLPPRTLKLTGKSMLVDIGVEASDMPNFFVEAITITDARVVQQLKDIPVPPEQRVINVSVEPSAERYLPGQEAEVEIKLTDLEGKPIQGSTVLTVYDRSVEYISGGSNVPEIREFFWQFRRSHYPSFETSLHRYFGILLKRGELGMQHLGVFGHLAADTLEGAGGGFGGGLGFEMKERRGVAFSMAPEPAAMEMDGAAAFPMAAAVDADGLADPLAEGGLGEGAGLVEPTIRKEFADTAYWNALITPDVQGVAKVTFPMPENLTGWKLKAWSIGTGTRVGEGEASAVTSKDVLVRLQAPRFFVEKDEVILSANVHNYLAESKEARVELVLEGDALEPLDALQRTARIDANGELRIDWKVRAVREGEAIITVKALTDADSDAMQMKFPVYVHGMLKLESYTGVLRADDPVGTFVVRVPAERRPEQTRLEIRYSPTLAGAMVDALPYMIDYPYGCTEQTLNRFLPSVITQNVLRRMNVNLEQIKQWQTNLNAQEIGDPAERARQWQRFEINPVFDTAVMEEIVKTNLKKLADMQLNDGGWGWFSGPYERSYPHTTATVVHGLQIAVANGLPLPEGMLERGVKWLEKYQSEQVRLLKRGEAKEPEQPYRRQVDNLDALVYMVLVDAEIENQAMQDYLERDRTKLSVYSLSMFGLALHKQNAVDRLDMVLRNLEQYYVEDLENETAYLKLPAGYAWWYWHGNEIEANAYYLKLLAKTAPQGVQAPRLVKYLLNNRKHSTYWNSTRDTALCIEAMAEYLQASGEDRPDFTLDVLVDGAVRKTVTINQENLFSFDGTLVLEGDELGTGEHTVEFRKVGKGPLYWNGYLTNFTLEDPIAATGLELKIRRKVYKLVQRKEEQTQVAGSRGQVIDQQTLKYDRVELRTGDEVTSGDLLEIELGIDSKNDYEYIVLEDFKAAGNEPVDVRSGYLPEANGAYVEFRDERVAFFMRSLQRGTSSLSYRLRAEIPGRFSALPAVGQAMYAPELRTNSEEFKLGIADRE
ncbi:MAG: alpha-2-macroglobulin [Planctomycetaceae bacterium]|nr:alpha-2-macroglobulin [Planctomycetaceae bacterium]